MKNLLSIGKFAKLCRTTVNTLIHYESIGLLPPTFITDTNRRLYDMGLCHTFSIIHTLAENGIPLSEIKTMLTTLSNKELSELLYQREMMLWQKISNLTFTRYYFETTYKQPLFPPQTDFGQPFICNQAQPLVLFATFFGYGRIPSSDRIPAIHYHQNKCLAMNIYPYPLGLILQKKSLYGQSNRRVLLYSPYPHGIVTNKTPILEAGEYAVILHKGSFESINDSIELLNCFIEEHHFILASDTYINFYHNSLPDTEESFYIIKIRFFRS
ncbi:MAG: MerR family transcriptional regulator [Lachnospiraceae bacterium]|nr:MerR family transcriptional regulator [Lachnospiraceae bacterium]